MSMTGSNGGINTYKNTGFLRTKYSIQLRPKAIIFDTPMVTTINLRVSIAPHKRSKYLSEAGITSRVKSSWGQY